jgi:dihydroorotate dehydrogenase electron transfer subunit
MPRELPEQVPIDESATIVCQHEVVPEHFRLLLRAPEIALAALPGQFLQIAVAERRDPLLRRPMSIGSVDIELGTVEVIYKVVGNGTDLLSHRVAGDRISVIGPLGHPFGLPDEGSVLLVGGGAGMPPMHFCASRLDPNRAVVVQGARRADLLLYREDLETRGVRHVITTEDGSTGERGFVTSVLEPLLADARSPVTVLTCGPMPMLTAVATLAREFGASCQVSMEEHMACGIGICMGCAVKEAQTEESAYRLVCVDGPVFESDDVISHESA